VCCAYADWDYDNRKPKNNRLSLSRDKKKSEFRHIIETKEKRGNKTVTVSETVIDDRGSYDPSRAKALFVVEYARWSGGRTGGGMNGYDDYPDGWWLSLRRLTPDGVYDPEGETIDCFEDLTGCFHKEHYITSYEIAGRMAKVFIKVK
jgi:hypothetical protein